jgi:hypothetical protein
LSEVVVLRLLHHSREQTAQDRSSVRFCPLVAVAARQAEAALLVVPVAAADFREQVEPETRHRQAQRKARMVVTQT